MPLDPNSRQLVTASPNPEPASDSLPHRDPGERTTGDQRKGRSQSGLSMQRITVGLLFLAGIVNFLDRSSLSIANGPIRLELHISGAQMGALLSVFSLSYGLAQLPAGRLLDRFGTRGVLAAGLLFWSAAQMATGLARGFAGFVPMRVALGVGEAPFVPAGVKAIHGWFAPGERGWPMALLNASSVLGLAAAPPLLTWLMLAAGWRAMFVAMGAAGIVLAAAWYPLYRDAPGEAVHPAAATGKTWAGLLKDRAMWGMILGFSGINYTAWLYLAWLPGYLQVARHLTLARTGWVAAVPFLFGACGMFVSGLAADRLVARGVTPIAGRKVLIVVGMVASAGCTLLVPQAASTRGAVFLISLALFAIHFAGTAAWGLVQFASPAGLVATVGTLQNFGSFMCASAAPVLTGWLLDRTHTFSLALVVCAGVTLGGALAYLVLAGRPISVTA